MLGLPDQIMACYWMTGNAREVSDVLDIPLQSVHYQIRRMGIQSGLIGRPRSSRVAVTEKLCPHCFLVKIASDFSRDQSRSDGLNGWCKACRCEAIRVYHLKRPGANVARVRKWRKANPDKFRAAATQWRHTRSTHAAAAASERVSFAYIYSRDRGLCHICKKRVRRGEGHLDHLVPLSLGGPTTVANLALAHASCNSKRGPGRLPAQLLIFG